MHEIPVPEAVTRQFEAKCHFDGLDPAGFKLKAYQTDSASPAEVVIQMGKMTYRYPMPDTRTDDNAWVGKFFDDLNADTADK